MSRIYDLSHSQSNIKFAQSKRDLKICKLAFSSHAMRINNTEKKEKQIISLLISEIEGTYIASY